MAPGTETRAAQNVGFEAWPTGDILRALHEGQGRGHACVADDLGALAAAVDAAAARLSSGEGRLIYIGAGTSGRLAVLDGVELTPTFGWPTERLVFLLAGGLGAMTTAVEGAEDDEAAAAADVAAARIGPGDVAIALAASGRTPYTCAALQAARDGGALSIGFAGNAATPLLQIAEHPIRIAAGPEVLAGSTRLAAGTAQKVALNLFSTTVMARLHRVFQGFMVDMLPTNAKLEKRAVAMISEICAVPKSVAAQALAQSGNRIKIAVLIARGHAPEQAEARLSDANGDLAVALGDQGVSTLP